MWVCDHLSVQVAAEHVLDLPSKLHLLSAHWRQLNPVAPHNCKGKKLAWWGGGRLVFPTIGRDVIVELIDARLFATERIDLRREFAVILEVCLSLRDVVVLH